MAFSSEVRFKIGADTSALSKAFVAAESAAATAGAIIHKKLGMKHLFQGLLQGIGIGSVESIANLVARPFEIAYERSKDVLGLTSRLREISTAEIVATGGQVAALREMRREVKDLNVDIEIQQKLVHDLESNPLTFINERSLTMLREAEHELTALKVRQAEVQSKLTMAIKTQQRETQAAVRADSATLDINDAELRSAGEREKLQIKLNYLQREYVVLAKQGNAETAAGRQNTRDQWATRHQMAMLDKTAREQQSAELVKIGTSVADKPKGRGRSETERIAARGAERVAQAREAARKGESPDFVARLTALGARDLKTAGERIDIATGKVAREDAMSLKGELVSANQTLKDISKNLSPAPLR